MTKECITPENLKEYMSRYQDIGCGLGWRCLECQLPKCLYDMAKPERMRAAYQIRRYGIEALIEEGEL